VFEKPTGGIDVDGEGLGADIVHELNEEQMRALEQAEKSAPPVHQGKLLPAQDGDQDANDEVRSNFCVVYVCFIADFKRFLCVLCDCWRRKQ
jgi:hypothetical protein